LLEHRAATDRRTQELLPGPLSTACLPIVDPDAVDSAALEAHVNPLSSVIEEFQLEINHP
jgi:hypothetical protein